MPMKKIKNGNIKKVLLVFDFADFIVNRRTNFVMISQFYQLIYFLKLKQKSISLACSDKAGYTDYQLLWKEESGLKNFVTDNTVYLKLANIRLTDFDLVILHSFHEKIIGEIAKQEESSEEAKMPYIFSFYRLNNIQANKFPLFTSYVDEMKEQVLLSTDKLEINKFRNLFPGAYIHFTVEKQCQLFIGLLDRIRQNNLKLLRRPIRNVLYIDDYKRRFFLGDSCFWIGQMREILADLTINGNLTINCNHPVLSELLPELFADINTTNISLTSNKFSDIDFKNFDLVLCHSDSIYSFMAFLRESKPATGYLLTDISFYHFDFNKESPKDNLWNYTWLKDEFSRRTDPLIRVKNFKARKYKEIPVSESEILWADHWFETMGVKHGENVILFNDESSNDIKNLSIETYFSTIRQLCDQQKYKILVFDYTNSGKKDFFRLHLNGHASQIIIAENPVIREEISLLASNYIRGIISPCTGIAHLANGIYCYLLNKKYRSKQKLPLILIYTGKNAQSDYHPADWWSNSLAKCIIYAKDTDTDSPGAFLSMSEIPQNLSAYQAMALPPRDIPEHLITSILTESLDQAIQVEK
jgi:hypothetical protein